MKTITVNNITIGEGMPKVCVPLTGTTKQQLEEQARQLKSTEFDLVEWRVDFFQHINDPMKVLEALRALRRTLPDVPLIFTFRSLQEGGEREIETEAYIELNKAMIETNKVDFVDIELFNKKETIHTIHTHAKQHGVYTIISNHDFQKTPAKKKIIDRMKTAQELGADLPKIAVMPQNMKDVLILLEATRELHDEHLDRPLISMSMGKDGIISRLTGEIFGSAITFGTVHHASAPGQVPVEDLKQTLQLIHRMQR